MGQILTSTKGQTPAPSMVLEGAAKGHIHPSFSLSNREAGGGQVWVPSPGSAPQGPAPGRISFASPLWQDAGVHAGSWPGLIPSPSVPDMSQDPHLPLAPWAPILGSIHSPAAPAPRGEDGQKRDKPFAGSCGSDQSKWEPIINSSRGDQ